MSNITALVINACGREGRLAISALSNNATEIWAVTRDGEGLHKDYADSKAVRHIAGDCKSEEDWHNIERMIGEKAISPTIIIHCPIGLSGSEGAEAEIHSAWLSAKFANNLLPAKDAVFLTILREAGGDVDKAAVERATIFAARCAQLDAFRDEKFIRSNRLTLSGDCSDEYVIANIAALCDTRSSFVAGADIRLEPALPSGGSSSNLEGKTILITGATSGIGRATAIEIGRRGGWVAVGGRKPDLGEETVALVREAGGEALFVPLDVTDPAAWDQAVATILSERGSIDGLVNNAGEAKNLPISELTEDVVRFLVHLNYGGCRLGMTSLLEPLGKSSGTIVNVASVAGLRAGFGGSAYGASKAAMIALSQSFAANIAGPKNVRVNCIQPGLIWSESVADSLGEEGAQQFREMIEGKTPLGRVGYPDEVGRFIAFLLSDAAAPIYGQAIPVSGGLELLHP